MNALLIISCSQPGNPLILTFTDEKNYKANFVLSTLPLPYFPKRLPLNSNMRTSGTAQSNYSDSFLYICWISRYWFYIVMHILSLFEIRNEDETRQSANNPAIMDTMTAPTQVLPVSSPDLSSTRITVGYYFISLSYFLDLFSFNGLLLLI